MSISKLILGTVQFGLDYGINNLCGKPNQLEVNEILKRSFEAGVTCLDTAEAYGDAHAVIGTFHQAYPAMQFKIISKFPKNLKENLEEKIDLYLKQTYSERIEGILFHSYDTYIGNRHLIERLDSLKNQNKIGKIGVSVYTNFQVSQVINDEQIDIIQLPFNLLDNVSQRGEVIKKAKSRGKIIQTRSAFLQGLFFSPLNSDNKVVQTLRAELEVINILAKDYQIPLQKLALSYCLSQQNIDNVLIGVDNIKQLNQNLADADFELPASLVQEIDKIFVQNIDMLNPSLWN